MRRACIDIGSNTTRLLVADCEPEAITEVHQERAFTHLALSGRADGAISPAKCAEIARVVAAQLATARRLGSGEVRAVATAAIRSAANRDELAAAIRDACGLDVRILTGEEEARLAFRGAARACGGAVDGELGVVDVGGGSSELVVGLPPAEVRWSVSLPLGSGGLARRYLGSDPPAPDELAEARQAVEDSLAGLEPPRPARAVAVGGSAASLAQVAGRTLNRRAFTHALEVLSAAPSAQVAARTGLEPERVRLLPAGLLILHAAAELFGVPLALAGGGLREGVLIEAAGG